MALTTTTTIAGPVNVVFQVNLLRNAKALAPYFMGTTPAEIAEHSGTFTAKWRRIENLTPVTTALAELTGSVSFPTRTAVQPNRQRNSEPTASCRSTHRRGVDRLWF